MNLATNCYDRLSLLHYLEWLFVIESQTKVIQAGLVDLLVHIFKADSEVNVQKFLLRSLDAHLA